MEQVALYSTYDIRVRAVRAFRDGMSVAEGAKAYQTHRATVHRWVKRYKQHRGVRGLVRRPVSGRPRKLDELDRRKLLSIVMKPASSFGYETDFWTCSRLLQVIRQEFEVSVSKMTMWRRLREASGSPGSEVESRLCPPSARMDTSSFGYLKNESCLTISSNF